jgi:hypothetical protein
MASTELLDFNILSIIQGIDGFPWPDPIVPYLAETSDPSWLEPGWVTFSATSGLTNLGWGFLDSLDQISGVLEIQGGIVTGDLTLADGTALSVALNIPAELQRLADLAATTNGTVTLNDGLLNLSLTAGTETATLSDLDLAAALGQGVLAAVNNLEATLPFTNGVFSLDFQTLLGPITGTVDVAGGDLNLDLTTPFGPLATVIDFGDDAQIPFNDGALSGVVNFNTGNVEVNLGSIAATVPISAFSGTLALDDGTTTLTTALPGLGQPVSFDLEVGPLASQVVVDWVRDLTVAGTITDGLIVATLENPSGLQEIRFDTVAFTNQGADFFAGVDGRIEISGGLLTADLTTPVGDLDGTINLGNVTFSWDLPLLAGA